MPGRVFFLIRRSCPTVALGAFLCVHARAETPRPTVSLESAYERTLNSDQSIRIAWWELRKASLLPLSALTKLGPQLSANIAYTPSSITAPKTATTNGLLGAVSSSTTNITTTTDLRTAGLVYQQTLFNFTVFPTYRLGKLTDESTRLQFTGIVRQTLFGVAQAYYDVLKQQAIVAVNDETLKLAEGQLDLSQKQFNVGQVARTDVLRARATLEAARRTLIQSQAVLALSRNTLANILNMSVQAEFTVAEPPPAPFDDEKFDAVLHQACARREDYKVAEIAIKQDVERRNVVKGQYAPTVVANVSPFLDSYSGAAGRQNGWQASVALSMPIFTGGQREIDLRTACYQIEETKLGFEKTVKSIEAEVKNSWLNVRTLREALKADHAGVEASAQNYKDLQAQYQVGQATSLDVDTALRDLNNTRTTLASDTYDYQVALRDLQRAQAAFQPLRVSRAMSLFVPPRRKPRAEISFPIHENVRHFSPHTCVRLRWRLVVVAEPQAG